MDVLFHLGDATFVWNEAKAAENLKKHGVAFPQACEVFFDPMLEFRDASRNEEERDAAIGHSMDGSLLFVVHLVKSEQLIRIISARTIAGGKRSQYENHE